MSPIYDLSSLLFLALSVGDALGRPATVKCRIGVDDEDSYEGTQREHVQQTFLYRAPPSIDIENNLYIYVCMYAFMYAHK